MLTRLQLFFLISAINYVFFAPYSTQAKTLNLRIPLTIQEDTQTARTSSAITSGLPLPRSARIKHTSWLRVVDNNGHTIPAQFTVEARWGGKPKDRSKPIKWVLIDFQVQRLNSNQQTNYYLTKGHNKTPSHPITIQQDAQIITITTGAARFVLNKTHFNLFQQVYLNNTALLKAKAASGSILQTSAGSYLAANGAPAEVTIEQAGPLRTTVLVKGWHYSEQGKKQLAYTARLNFYAGQSYVRVFSGVWNDNVMLNDNGQPNIKEFGSPHNIVFSSLVLLMQLSTVNWLTYTMAGAGQQTWHGSLTEQARIYQDSSGGPQWHHLPDNADTTFRGFTAFANDRTLQEACDDNTDEQYCRANGWLDLSSAQGGLAVGVRHFWQNFPKVLAAHLDGTIQIGLFPEEFSSDYELRVGEQKTHEVVFYFHDRNTKTAALSATMNDLLNPLQAWAPAKWYLTKAKVFDHSIPYNAKQFPEYEGYNDAAITYKDANLFLLHNGTISAQWVYNGRTEQWGWRNVGDTIAEDETSPTDWPVFTNQQYDHPFFYVYQMIRTLSTKSARPKLWWQLAELSARHQADIDIIHSRCTGKTEIKMLECMDNTVPYAVGWAMGGRLTNQWHADASTNIHRHALIDSWSGGIRGELNYWYLTGEGSIREAWQELAKNTLWRVNNSPCNQDSSQGCGPGYADSRLGEVDTREGAYNIEILTDAFTATGDQRYLKAAQIIIQATNPRYSWLGTEFALHSEAQPAGKSIWPGGLGLQMRAVGRYLDIYQEWFGKIDHEAQDNLIVSAQLMSQWWQLGSNQPTQYRIYENGAIDALEADPLDTAVADGLIWALDYNNGHLDIPRVQQVAKAAFERGSTPWGNYGHNVFMTTKTQVMMGISGWRYMAYALKH